MIWTGILGGLAELKWTGSIQQSVIPRAGALNPNWWEERVQYEQVVRAEKEKAKNVAECTEGKTGGGGGRDDGSSDGC